MGDSLDRLKNVLDETDSIIESTALGAMERTQAIRGGKRVILKRRARKIEREGYKLQDGKLVRMDRAERRRRQKATRKSARKASTKRAKDISLRRRKQLIGDS